MQQIEFEALTANARTPLNEIQRVWDAAARIDGSLKTPPKLIRALAAKRIEPLSYSRSRLFERMLLCQPSLFRNFPIRWHSCPNRRPKIPLIIEELRNGIPRTKQARLRTGGAVRHQPIAAILERWMEEKSVFGVTDLHYIGSRFDRRIETGNLNDFNLLPRGTDGFQSQDSLVISSRGAFTDSHSDDHSGSNHCFTGTKLWLLWDTLEGLKHGLQDVEHCNVYDQAAFDLPAFLAMRSSSWILIGPGQTVFVPANLTHKVITLQRYLGLGNFYAAFPGFVDSLIRWQQLLPIWASRSAGATHHAVEFVTRRAIRRLQSLRQASRSERHHWGVPYLKARLQRPDMRCEAVGRNANPNLTAFIHTAREIV